MGQARVTVVAKALAVAVMEEVVQVEAMQVEAVSARAAATAVGEVAAPDRVGTMATAASMEAASRERL